MTAPSQFPRLRGDAHDSRTQDNIAGTLTPIASALNATPIMGAAAPAWIAPDLVADFANYGSGFAVAGYHKDCLGYVHGKGKITSAAGVAIGFVMLILPTGYRPSETLTFAVEGSGAFQSIRVAPNGEVSPAIAVAAGGTVDLDFSFLAEQ